MLPTQTLDLTQIPDVDRFEFWHDLISTSTAPSRFTSPAAGNFAGFARVADLGGLRLTSFRYPALEMARTEKMIRQGDPEMYELALPITGRSALTQERRESAVKPGAEFTFLTTSRPYTCFHIPLQRPQGPENGHQPLPQTAKTVAILFPQSALPLPPNKINQLLAGRLSANEGMASLLAQFLRQVGDHPELFKPADAVRLGRTAMDLIAATLAQHLDIERSLPIEVQQQALRTRIDDFINRNLGDEDLTPRTVAAAHHISLRSLHRLFVGEETTVAELIRTRRLDRVRRDLTNPLMASQPIYAIAARWAFPDKAHFSRLFRATYGMSPQQYRQHPPVLFG
ncbi:helix-turn-helix domain-containing protein [Micromonospora arborensis]|uniref:helix-turn-helix domain-containing protein n=1 Tax=Micromonospora arborensis TaxID=2116518 RepID=UPI0033C7F424